MTSRIPRLSASSTYLRMFALFASVSVDGTTERNHARCGYRMQRAPLDARPTLAVPRCMPHWNPPRDASPLSSIHLVERALPSKPRPRHNAPTVTAVNRRCAVEHRSHELIAPAGPGLARGLPRLPLWGGDQHRDVLVGLYLVDVLLIPIAGVRGDCLRAARSIPALLQLIQRAVTIGSSCGKSAELLVISAATTSPLVDRSPIVIALNEPKPDRDRLRIRIGDVHLPSRQGPAADTG